jgi:hypothetical protein
MKKINLFPILVSTLVVLSLSGCGNVSSNQVIADSVSSYEYDNMTCSAIEAEISHLQRAASAAGGVVDNKKSSQQGKGAAAFLLFWPALFIIDDNSLEAQKYARLKGEYEAASKAHRKKEC